MIQLIITVGDDEGLTVEEVRAGVQRALDSDVRCPPATVGAGLTVTGTAGSRPERQAGRHAPGARVPAGHHC